MIVGLIQEITVYDVFDRGVPNQERIVLRINETLNLGRYGLMLGIRAENGSAFPLRDNLLWFGDAIVNRGDWLFVYTGPGEPKASPVPNGQENMYSIHWGRPHVILHNRDVVPILFRVDAVQVPNSSTLLPAKTGG